MKRKFQKVFALVLVLALTVGAFTMLSVVAESTEGEIIVYESYTYNDFKPLINSHTAPVKNGYLFAGWFNDDQGDSAIADSGDVKSGTSVYAKFIRADMSRIAVQLDYSSSDPIILSDGSNTASHWSYAISSNMRQNDTNGNPDSHVHVECGRGALRELTFTPSSAVDMSSRTTIQWDICVIESTGVENFEAVKAAYESTMKLTVSDGENTAVIPISQWNVGSTDYRWREVSASLKNSGLNLSHITSFQWCFVPTGTGVNNSLPEKVFVRFDNVKAITKSEISELSDGSDKVTHWVYSGNSSSFGQNEANGNPGNCIHVATGHGALRELTFTPESPVNMVAKSTIQWDMSVYKAEGAVECFNDVKAAYTNTMKLTVSDGTNTAVIPVSEWSVGNATGNNSRWRTIRVSLENREINLSNIVSFQWSTLASTESNDLLATSLPDIVCRFDNVKAIQLRTMRLVSIVDSTHYDTIGFKLYRRTAAGVESSQILSKGTKIYSSLRKYTNETNHVDVGPVSVFGSDATGFKFTTVKVKNITEAHFDSSIIARPFWKTVDGTEVDGLGEFNSVDSYLNRTVNISINTKQAARIAAGMLTVNYDNSKFSYLGADYGRVFSEMSFLNTGSSVKCVGVVGDASANSPNPNDVFVNLKFAKKDGVTLTKGDSSFSVIIGENSFCDINEAFNNSVTAPAIKY